MRRNKREAVAWARQRAPEELKPDVRREDVEEWH